MGVVAAYKTKSELSLCFQGADGKGESALLDPGPCSWSASW